MKSTLHDRLNELESKEIMELTARMQVTPPPLPDKPEMQLLTAKEPYHPTVKSRYLRGTYLRQLLSLTEIARLFFELKEPRYDCSDLQAVSRELTISCTLIEMLYEKAGNLKPEAAEITQQSDWDLCQECISAERDIRNCLLSLETRLANQQRNAA